MMMNSGRYPDLAEALNTAVNYAGLEYDDISLEKAALTGDALGMNYELEFITSCLRYYCYIDAHNGEVVGFLAVPCDKHAAITTAA